MKGIHKVKRPLAGGGHSTHYYAWRGGPRIDAEYGTADFLAQWQAHCAAREKPTHHTGTFQTIITAYQQNHAFTKLADATRAGYIRHIKTIEQEFGDLPIAALSDPRIRAVFLDWRDKKGATNPRTADYAFAVLALIIAWAYDRREISANHCERPRRLYSNTRVDIIWTDADIAALLAAAPPHVALPFRLALDTGQREGDILSLTWAAYDGQALHIKQSKTKRRITIPLLAETRAMLDAAKSRRKTMMICETSRGTKWAKSKEGAFDGYKSSFDAAKEAAGIENLTFHDTRGTAVVRLGRAGCTIPEIASFTGHSPKDAENILARHYMASDRHIAESAVAKLEKHNARTKPVNGGVNGGK